MANYTKSISKTWGASGSVFPDGYSYLEGEQPVDEWDNYVNTGLINDVSHLVDLTNDRIESDSGTSGSEPGTPDAAHLYYDTDNERVEYYDTNASTWRNLLNADGTIPLQNGLTYPDDAGSAEAMDFTVTSSPAAGTEESYNFKIDGTEILEVYAEADGTGGIQNSAVNISGSRALTAADEGPGNGLDADTLDGEHAADIFSVEEIEENSAVWSDGFAPNFAG